MAHAEGSFKKKKEIHDFFFLLSTLFSLLSGKKMEKEKKETFRVCVCVCVCEEKIANVPSGGQ